MRRHEVTSAARSAKSLRRSFNGYIIVHAFHAAQTAVVASSNALRCRNMGVVRLDLPCFLARAIQGFASGELAFWVSIAIIMLSSIPMPT